MFPNLCLASSSPPSKLHPSDTGCKKRLLHGIKSLCNSLINCSLERMVLLHFVVMVAEVAAHAVAADGFPVAEFNVAVVELEVDTAVVRDRILIRIFGGCAVFLADADTAEATARGRAGNISFSRKSLPTASSRRISRTRHIPY